MKSGLAELRTRALICLALVAVTCVIYGQTGGFDFVNYDDNVLVYENSTVTQGVTLDNLRWAFLTMPEGAWQPLSWLSHMLDCQLFGLDAGGHHLVSVLLHALNSVLLFLALGRLTGSLWRSAMVAALFALHPQHVEAVAWVAARKDVLSTCGWLLTLWAYGVWVERPTRWHYATIVLFFAIGLMAKPMVVTLPLVLLLLDVWPLGRLPKEGGLWVQLRQVFWLVVEKVPLFMLALAASMLTVMAEMQIGTIASLARFSIMTRLTNTIISYGSYLLKTVWPVPLLPFYLYPDHIPWDQTTASLALLLLISAVSLLKFRRHPYLIVGWGWYLIVLLPVIGLVQMGPVPRADRYVYLPHIGIFIMMVWGGAALVKGWRWRPAWQGVMCGVVLLATAGVAYRQIGLWQDSRTLFGYTLAVDPGNSEAAIQLGEEYREHGELAESLSYLTLAVRLAPFNHEAVGSLGKTYERMENLEEALRCYAEAIRLDPSFVMVYDHMGIIAVKLGDLELAKRSFAKSLEYSPNDAKALINYGLALYLGNQLPEAEEYFSKAVKFDPGSADAYNGLGLIFLKQGRIAEAVTAFQQALTIAPGYEHARDNLQKALEAQAKEGAGEIRDRSRPRE
jgi:Flp pilus assembly protein TadD